MKPETWHTIAAILLIAGILLLIAAIICAVRFQFFSMIRTELHNRKEQQTAGTQDYFAHVGPNKIETLPEPVQAADAHSDHTKTEQHIAKNAPVSETVPVSRKSDSLPQPAAGTVPAGKRRQNRSDAGTVVISARRRQPEPEQNDSVFTVTDCILEMCGDPHAVSRFKTTSRKGTTNE